MHHIFLVGWPKSVGGANTEAWHTIKLWLRYGCRVTVIPTWTASEPTRSRLMALGAEVAPTTPEALGDVPKLRGAIVASFSNTRFIAEAWRFKAMGCRIIWASCMVFQLPGEDSHYREHGLFDCHLCQSEYQRAKIVPHLRCPDFHGGAFGQPPIEIIPGAFDVEEFPLAPLPHRPGERFVIGRLSRDDPEKFPGHRTGPLNLWEQYRRIPYPTSARVMGLSPRGIERTGNPPAWVEAMPCDAETSREFLGKIHALVPGFDCCVENWPRVGLEAMAAGVPIVAQNRGGWRDMLHPEQPPNGRTRRQLIGDLIESVDEQAYVVARLAYDERFRMDRIIEARWQLEHILANPQLIWEKWDALFTRLTCKTPSTV